MTEVKMEWLPKVIMGNSSDFDKNWSEYMSAYDAKIDYKAYQEALTKEVKRRVKVDKELQGKVKEEEASESSSK